MALNLLVAVQTKTTIDTTKHLNKFLNNSVTHPDTVTVYIKIGMIIQIYLNASYI